MSNYERNVRNPTRKINYPAAKVDANYEWCILTMTHLMSPGRMTTPSVRSRS